MTLSRWLRDYLYISLGGNRKGAYKTMRNLFLTMFLGGLWHGASWNFAIWGVLHGSYLAIERQVHKINFSPIPDILRKTFAWVVTFHLVVFAWVFFRAENFSDSATVLNNMADISWGDFSVVNQWIWFLPVFLMPVLHWVSARLDLTEKCRSMNTAEFVLWFTALLVALILFRATESDSFIYFQF